MVHITPSQHLWLMENAKRALFTNLWQFLYYVCMYYNVLLLLLNSCLGIFFYFEQLFFFLAFVNSHKMLMNH